MIFNLFGDRKKRQAKQFNRDAPIIIEQAEQMFTDNRLAEIAATVREHLDRAHTLFGREGVDLHRAHDEYRKLHKVARQRNEQANLTAITLVIIHLRAEIAGIDAAPARAAIDQFLARWSKDDIDAAEIAPAP